MIKQDEEKLVTGLDREVLELDNEGLRFTAKGNFATRTDMSILDVNGNVGIGTINPLSRLDIAPSGVWLI